MKNKLNVVKSLREPLEVYGKRKFTVAEYLAIERSSESKFEFYEGEIFEMAGASRDHCEISTNLMREIFQALTHKPCKPYASDLRLYIPENGLFTHPDIAILCKPLGELAWEDDSFVNPMILIEILSPATRTYDLGRKFQFYQNIPTLCAYVVVDSARVFACVHSITGGKTWEGVEYSKLTDILKIEAIGCALPLKTVYDDTSLVRKQTPGSDSG